MLYIGIYPEWNVKFNLKKTLKNFKAIGIYPEWNVKGDRQCETLC